MKIVLLLFFVCISPLSQALEKQVGIYVESVELEINAAETYGIGSNLKSIGMSVAIRKPWLRDSAFQYSLGAGLSMGKDEESFSQQVTQGFGAGEEHKSSILGFSGFADIGHSAEFFGSVRSYAGLGASYFSVERQITDCANCERQEIALPVAPYAKLGMEYCSSKHCLQVNYRQFISTEFNSGIFISFQGKR